MGLRSKLGLLLSLLLAGSMWFYVKHVLVPYQVADAAAHDRPRGILSDLYPRWFGAHELLLHHRDPYSPEVTRDIQIGYYGRPLDPSRPNDPKDQQGFAYPLYVVFLLAPIANLPFAEIEPVFRWLLVGLVVATVWAWTRFLQWRPSPATAVSALALTLGSFALAQGILLGQLTILVSALVAAALLALMSGHLLVAGCVLGVATIKPQLVWPLLVWLFLWAVSDWRARQRFFWGLGLTGTVLAVGAEMALPGWIGRFLTAIAAYRQYTGAQSIFTTMTTPLVGAVINCLILLAVAVVCWRARKQASTSTQFAMVSSTVLAATIVTVSSVAPYNQILLLPAVFILWKSWKLSWNSSAFARFVIVAGGSFVCWPWLSALAIVMAAPFVSPAALQSAWRLPLFSSLAIPPAILALLVLNRRTAAPPNEPVQ